MIIASDNKNDDDDNNDDDDDGKDNDNDEDDDDDDDNDDDWLLCCNCNISLNLATWSNNNLIISSLDFNYFHRKYTSSRTWAVDILESSVWESTSFLNESNDSSLNALTSVKNVFFFQWIKIFYQIFFKILVTKFKKLKANMEKIIKYTKRVE